MPLSVVDALRIQPQTEPEISDRLLTLLESSCAGLMALESASARAAQLADEVRATQRQLTDAAELLRGAIAAVRAAAGAGTSEAPLGFVLEPPQSSPRRTA